MASMRSIEEVETKMTVLINTMRSIEELEDSGNLDKDTAAQYREVVRSTMNLMEWFKGNDVEVMADLPVLDKVTLIAQDVELFKVLELDS